MTNPSADDAALAIVLRALRPVMSGLMHGALALVLGFSFDVVFGVHRDVIKSRLTASAESAAATVYHHDTAAMDGYEQIGRVAARGTATRHEAEYTGGTFSSRSCGCLFTSAAASSTATCGVDDRAGDTVELGVEAGRTDNQRVGEQRGLRTWQPFAAHSSPA